MTADNESGKSAPLETTPLLQKPKESNTPDYGKAVVLRVLFTAFIVSVSFGVTQVPLIFVFGSMTCTEYYKTHPDPGPDSDRCRHPEIDAGAARAIALLATSTTIFGVANLFLTGWWIKRYGIKSSLLVSVFWPAIRLLVQNVGVEVGAGLGIIIIQLSQIFTIFGGPAGYLLSLNSFAAEVVRPSERTAILGQLTGSSMFGMSAGFLVGGLLEDLFGIRIPFRVTFILFLVSSLYIWLGLPSIDGEVSAADLKKTQSLSSFFEPLLIFVPQKWVSTEGKTKKERGVLLLGIGAFLAVLATGYIPTLLQLYSIDVLGFHSTENGWLISLNCMVRGIFLTFIFPMIISEGRKWTDRRTTAQDKVAWGEAGIRDLPTDPTEILPEAIEGGQEPTEPSKPKSEEEQSFQFDLTYTRWSIFVDAILTAGATFVSKGWQVYLVAVILPLASGTGSAAKGTILQMCSPSQRTDALSAISLIEMVARLATVSAFGFLFSIFAAIGKPYLTFTCNAATALLAFSVLCLARFPAPGSKRLADVEDSSS